MSQTEREMGYHIVKYLETIGYEQSQQTRKKVSELTSTLSKLFIVDTKSIEDFKALEYYHADLYDILNKGVQKLEAGHFDADLAEAQSNEKFANFSAVISGRQYFEGATEGTLEHLRRRSRVLSKFREKYPKTDLTIDDPNHPLRALLSKSKISSPSGKGASTFSPPKSSSPAKLGEMEEEKSEGKKEEIKEEEPKKVEVTTEESKKEEVKRMEPEMEEIKSDEGEKKEIKKEVKKEEMKAAKSEKEETKKEVKVEKLLPPPPSKQEKPSAPPPATATAPTATSSAGQGKKNKKKKGKK